MDSAFENDSDWRFIEPRGLVLVLRRSLQLFLARNGIHVVKALLLVVPVAGCRQQLVGSWLSVVIEVFLRTKYNIYGRTTAV